MPEARFRRLPMTRRRVLRTLTLIVVGFTAGAVITWVVAGTAFAAVAAVWFQVVWHEGV
jgi:hypothetical protein